MGLLARSSQNVASIEMRWRPRRQEAAEKRLIMRICSTKGMTSREGGECLRPLRVRSTERAATNVDTSPRHPGLGSSFGNRMRLNAALANTNNQSTLASPRSLTLRIQDLCVSNSQFSR